MASDENTEVSVAEAYCVVYTLDNKEWVVTGEGWAQVHLYRDQTDDTHRIVGWTVEDSQVVINSNVTFACKYKKKSDDFHKFVDEEDRTFGFGFWKKDDSFEESDKFMSAVNTVIDKEKENPPEMIPQTSMSTISPSLEQSESSQKLTPQNESLSSKTSKKLGRLQIFNPKPGRSKIIRKKKKGKEPIISDPFSIEHKDHVEFNPETRTFVGLPDEWKASIDKQFGVPFTQLPTVKIDGYQAEIPKVLITMKDYFLKHDGLETEGVFRIAPDGEESDYVKDLLNKGKFEKCDDIHCMSHLIKVFFREIPLSVIVGIQPETIIECKTPETAGQILLTLTEPQLSSFLWLLDLMIMVSDQGKVNKMSDQALAIVIAPNIFEGLQMAVTLQLVFAPKAASFLRLALTHRRKAAKIE